MKKISRYIYNFVRRIYKILLLSRNYIIGGIFRLFPIQSDKIVVSNFLGKGYGDNPKYVVDYLLKSKVDIKIIWLIKKNQSLLDMPNEVKVVRYGSIRSLYEYATSKIWLDNSRKEYCINKRKNQYYIQLWHGGVGLKKVEAAALDTLDKEYIKIAKRDSSMIDYAISNSTYRTNIYKNWFWYDGEVLEYGCPRNDVFFKGNKANIKQNICNKYNINENNKLILYVPTFRKNKDFNYASIDMAKMLNELYEKSKCNYSILIKFHPNVKEQLVISNPNIHVIPFYEDVDELLMISDIIISDYSSVIFDYLLIGKEVYLYSPDYEEYVDERGLNFEYSKLPFPISYTSDELIFKIKNEESKKYYEKIDKFLNEVNIIDDGHSSERVGNLIFSLLKKGKNDEKI